MFAGYVFWENKCLRDNGLKTCVGSGFGKKKCLRYMLFTNLSISLMWAIAGGSVFGECDHVLIAFASCIPPGWYLSFFCSILMASYLVFAALGPGHVSR